MTRATDFAMRMASAAAALVLVTGCAKSDDSTPSAETPIGDVKLASAGMPAADLTYVSDQSQVKLVTAPAVSYEPLESFRGKGGGDAATTGDEGAAAAGAPAGKAGPMTRAKMAMASMLGGLMGGGGKAGGPPPTAGATETGASDGPAVALVAMREALAELPKHPSDVTGEPVESAKTAAIALAKEHLAKRIFAMKISADKTVGEAIGADADPKKMDFSAAVMVGAKWLNPNKLEVEIICKLSDVVAELEQKFSSLDLTVVKAMDQDKGLAAKGTGDLKHEKDAPKHAKPGEMSRHAAEEGGLGG